MAGPWLECVPNLSLGRSLAEVRRVARGLGEVLLDVHRDRDHDRTVLTLYGPPGDLGAALMAVADRALPCIDLATQRGVHPRVGALDVVPFVPVEGARMASAIRAAREFAARFARSYEIPVFLYGEASGEPGRELPRLRRGGLAGLARRMARGLAPDFGPPAPHPRWGVTLVGAREVLVAYNVDLPAARAEQARELARELRSSGGGLPALRALGLELRAPRRAQLSMNFLDHAATCPSQVLARLEAEQVPVERSEVVGLLPEQVLVRAARRQLRLDEDFDPARHLLERRLRVARARRDARELAAALPPEQARQVRAALARALGVGMQELA